MPAIVTRLRIAGFKSFAEPTTIDILPGLTGIVGPNGCGKSNVVEALRWAMGETSARSLRGGEMDEVIFAGSAARPSRNIAEVVVTLDDAAGLAPAPLHGEIELQVSRQIERGAGSTYRVNGREMRARDVQTMFADIASGARSSAMVSQGRVAFLVDARPEDRRSVLEEAAGITGLHARRHEAEIRLRAAEANLGRVGDLRSGLEGRHTTLARQAEAARSYREAVDTLAHAERALLGIMLGGARRAVVESGRTVAHARAGLTAAEQAASGAERDERAAEASLGDSGRALSLAATAVERARAALETVEAEAARAAESLAGIETRLAEATRDQALAARQAEDSEAALSALTREAETLRGVLDRFAERHRTEVAARDAASLAVAREADRHGARLRADQDIAALETAHRTMTSRRETVEAALAELEALAVERGVLENAAAFVVTAERALADARAATRTAEAERRAADDAVAGIAREEAALRDSAGRAAAGRDAARARHDRVAGEHDAVMARLEAARAAMIVPGAVERALAAAASARDDVEMAASALGAAEIERARAEAASLAARETAREAHARARDIASDLERLEREQARLRMRHADLNAAHDKAKDELVGHDALIGARETAAASLASLAHARARAAGAEGLCHEAMASAAAIRGALMSCDAGITAAKVEIAALGAIDGANWPLLSAIRVPEALERAVAAGLGDALAASLDPADPRHWLALGPLDDQALPAPAVALAGLIDAPEALNRALSRIGLVDEAEARTLQAALAAGQALVSLDGSLFRWDGLVLGDQPSPVTERLRARRRLDQCETSLAEALAARPALETSLAEAEWHLAACERCLVEARAATEDGERAAAAASASEAALVAREVTTRARADSVGAELARVAASLAEVGEQATARRAADGQEGERLSALERAASSEFDRAVAAERHARDALRAAETRQAEMDAEARRLAARDEASAATLATLERMLGALDEALTASRAELADASGDADAHALEAMAGRVASAAGHAEACRLADTACRDERARAEAAIDRARLDHAALLDRARDVETRRAVLLPECQAIAASCAQSVDRLSQARQARAALGPEEGALAQARQAEVECERRAASLEAEAAQSRTRLDAIASLGPAARQRRDEAGARVAELGLRLDEIRRMHAAARDAPEALRASGEMASRAFDNAEQAREAASRRAMADQDDASARREARRDADMAVASAREAWLRAEAAEIQAAGTLADIDARVLEAGGRIEPAEATAAAETEARRRVARALAARDAVGPVNLLAQAEADEVGQRLAALVAEAADLEEAVARLRGSIGHINREGRERLTASFVRIDAQFRVLFGRMFDGGRAHLALVGSDDPLEAGLEIYAQPPGKKLATLSLLSGGEQALTALSLIFAAFRCNPAPVCVLDEVDAPLDDANVERFCRLVSDMASESGTRFLVVTHHQLTMASMDRLFGVTMQERGVSRLLSVDLGRAVEMTAQ